ncbi:MAG TPA: PAS domain-containing protein, partial [Thermoleophilia bacterium]|nr:PAS domain-containing protein [Thermoleophilia bacterium]
MSDPFEAFLKSAQYLARVRSRQDVLEQAGRLITNHFPAEWVAFGERQGQEELSIHSCTSSNPQVAQLLAGKELCAMAGDVLGTGFLAMRVISTSSPMITAVFPLTEGDQTEAVMFVGHPGLEPISAEFLNVYLALAGLVGTTIDRLRNEEELALHRMYLEDLVDERTRELEEAKNRNELILQSVGEGICGLDVDGRITFANPYAASTLGWDPGDLLGRDAHETFHHRHADGSPYLSEECSVRAHMTGRRA